MDCKAPINRQAAEILAQAYFEHVFGLCGALGEVIESPFSWSFPCRVGYGASPAGPIIIDKKSGQITCESEESFRSPTEFLKHLTLRSTRTLPLRGTVLNHRSDFSSLTRRAASAAPVSFDR